MKSLPDYLALRLDILFVGINPSIVSAEQGHYYANPRNRFWRAFNLAGMAPEPLWPESDYRVLEFGMGFTDLAKRPTRGMSDLRADEFRQGAAALREKLRRYRPRLVCFQGLTASAGYLRYTQGFRGRVTPGLQPSPPGEPAIFTMPSPSPANAAVSLEELVDWYRRLRGLRDELVRSG
jgi:TDG/mug DNA glycosylase family protein